MVREKVEEVLFLILNVAGFRICKSIQVSKYATIWLKMSEQYVNMPEHVCIYNNRKCSEYVSYDA